VSIYVFSFRVRSLDARCFSQTRVCLSSYRLRWQSRVYRRACGTCGILCGVSVYCFSSFSLREKIRVVFWHLTISYSNSEKVIEPSQTGERNKKEKNRTLKEEKNKSVIVVVDDEDEEDEKDDDGDDGEDDAGTIATTVGKLEDVPTLPLRCECVPRVRVKFHREDE